MPKNPPENMPDDTSDDVQLDAFFQAARDADITPPFHVMDRVLADASAVQAGFGGRAVPKGFMDRLQDAIQLLGGWPSMAGLATAAITGVSIGIFSPAHLSGVADVMLGSENEFYLVDMSPELDIGLIEEAL